MKTIAILIADSIYNRKGMMNAELNRISHLLKVSNYNIDVFTFQTYFGWLVRKIRHLQKNNHPQSVILDGIHINIEWRKYSIIDYFLMVRLSRSPIVTKNWQLKYVNKFKDYDIIVANSTELAYLAYHINKRFSIPYYVTWHGSDIHTAPFANKSVFDKTKLALEGAELNFMVSNALLETSKKISTRANTMVLYNGVSSKFYRYSNERLIALKAQNGTIDKKIVAFAGHIIEVKNPQLLPEIFKSVNENFQSPIEFWIMGTGKMGSYVENKSIEYGLPLKMFGNIPTDEMPNMLNCVDVLVLPSRNEGLPLIAVEAIACGANAVGAKVGGIPEVMGEENTFSHGDDFIKEISERIVYMLNNKVNQPLLPMFSWLRIAQIENEIYKKKLM